MLGGGLQLPPTLPAPGQGRECDLPKLWVCGGSHLALQELCSGLQPLQPTLDSCDEPAAVLSPGTSSFGHPW